MSPLQYYAVPDEIWMKILGFTTLPNVACKEYSGGEAENWGGAEAEPRRGALGVGGNRVYGGLGERKSPLGEQVSENDLHWSAGLGREIILFMGCAACAGNFWWPKIRPLQNK